MMTRSRPAIARRERSERVARARSCRARRLEEDVRRVDAFDGTAAAPSPRRPRSRARSTTSAARADSSCCSRAVCRAFHSAAAARRPGGDERRSRSARARRRRAPEWRSLSGAAASSCRQDRVGRCVHDAIRQQCRAPQCEDHATTARPTRRRRGGSEDRGARAWRALTRRKAAAGMPTPMHRRTHALQARGSPNRSRRPAPDAACIKTLVRASTRAWRRCNACGHEILSGSCAVLAGVASMRTAAKIRFSGRSIAPEDGRRDRGEATWPEEGRRAGLARVDTIEGSSHRLSSRRTRGPIWVRARRAASRATPARALSKIDEFTKARGRRSSALAGSCARCTPATSPRGELLAAPRARLRAARGRHARRRRIWWILEQPHNRARCGGASRTACCETG